MLTDIFRQTSFLSPHFTESASFWCRITRGNQGINYVKHTSRPSKPSFMREKKVKLEGLIIKLNYRVISFWYWIRQKKGDIYIKHKVKALICCKKYIAYIWEIYTFSMKEKCTLLYDHGQIQEFKYLTHYTTLVG